VVGGTGTCRGLRTIVGLGDDMAGAEFGRDCDELGEGMNVEVDDAV
jgi:hypothetical protein